MSGQESAIVRNYTRAVGGLHDIGGVTEDRNGDLWVATGNGAARLARDGFTSFGEEDGLALPANGDLFTNRAGELCGHFATRNGMLLIRFDGVRFVPLWPELPAAVTRSPGWGPNRVLEDREGHWWIGTERGLFRFARAAAVIPDRVFTSKDGLAGDHIFSLLEDSRGDLWVALAESPRGLCRWSRASGTFECYSIADGQDLLRGNLISAMAEDGTGGIWFGRYFGGVVRYREGRLTSVPREKIPAGMITKIHSDTAGRLWIASGSGGVARIDRPAAEQVEIKRYTTSDGLPTNSVNDVTQDRWGRIYLATDRGVCRLDPATGRIKQYSGPESGLPENQVRHAARDAHGALWFATLSGVARLTPSPESPVAPPAIVIAGLRIAGKPHPVRELGETELSGIVAGPQQNQLQIDFAGMGAAAGERLRYRYKLEGGGDNWSAPSTERIVNLAGLAPGSYRFLVQAVGMDGSVSAVPALVSFTIRPPLWRRGWFLCLAAAMLMASAYMLHRYRVARLLELERVRTRIATDLHDDVGASLSQVAILSEVTREQIRRGSPGALDTAGQIAETARSMLDSMSDIVWSIDPRRDDLSSLVQRVRRFASDVLDGRGIPWSFDAPDDLAGVYLSPEQRRQVYLVLKEAIHNAARHAGADRVAIRISVAERRLNGSVADNGSGIRESNCQQGYGLTSMKTRVADLGGVLRIDSRPGEGTEVGFHVPL